MRKKSVVIISPAKYAIWRYGESELKFNLKTELIALPPLPRSKVKVVGDEYHISPAHIAYSGNSDPSIILEAGNDETFEIIKQKKEQNET